MMNILEEYYIGGVIRRAAEKTKIPAWESEPTLLRSPLTAVRNFFG